MASPALSSLSGGPGSGAGVSGPAFAEAQPRPQPGLLAQVSGAPDGPTAQELRASWEAYNGVFDGQKEGPLASQSGVPDLNVKSNRIKPIVNTGVNFLFGPSLSLRVSDAVADEDAGRPGVKTQVEVSDTAQLAQRLIDTFFGDDDERMTLFSKMGVNGSVYGHVFVKVVAPRRGRASVVNPPRAVLLNPETVQVFTDPEDADLVARYRIEYATTDARGNALRRRQDITRVDPDGDDAATAAGLDSDTTWLIENSVASGLTGGKFSPDGAPIAWPYPLPPITEWQNFPNPNAHWGQRDVTDGLVALNAQLRLVESNINKIGFLQGHPFLFATGADTGGLRPTPGQIMDLGAPDADLKAVNAAGDLAQLMAFAEQLRSDMDEESGIPGVATGRMETLPRGQVSGITMRLLYAPLLARTEHKRRLYGQGIRQLCATALLVCGLDMPTIQNLDIALGWQDPLPADDLANAQTAVALQGIGYSQHTLIERTGGDPDDEAQWRAEEQQAQMSAVLHGAAMPPAPATPPEPGQQKPQAPSEDGEPTESAPAKPAQPPARPAVDPNHPAAVAARAKVRAAFGKPPMGPAKQQPARRRK